MSKLEHKCVVDTLLGQKHLAAPYQRVVFLVSCQELVKQIQRTEVSDFLDQKFEKVQKLTFLFNSSSGT